MKTLLDTSNIDPGNRFDFWDASLKQRFMPFQQKLIGNGPFEGKIEAADVGSIQMTRVVRSALRTESTPDLIRQHLDRDYVMAALVLSGTQKVIQSGREYFQKVGEFNIFDHAPCITQTDEASRILFLKLKRAPLERVLGQISMYSGLTVPRNQPSLMLMANYLRGLMRVHNDLTTSAADRASSVCIDLIINSIAERTAQATPKSIAGTILVQRAKAYIEANLSKPSLDSAQLAAAMKISLRRLQQIFQEHDQNISDWIWQRRVEVAASRLSDPASFSLRIGEVAYNCGFTSQSHFSHRFRENFGLSPTEFRNQFSHK